MYCGRVLVLFTVFVFKQKTAYEMRISDWSSDVCSSDLVATNSGAVEAKVAVPDANEFKAMAPDPDLVAFAGQDGALYYTDAQRLSNQSRIVQDFQQAFGVTSRKEMFSILSGGRAEGDRKSTRLNSSH